MLKNSRIKYFGKCRCVFDARSASLINSSRERETFAFLFWTFEDVVIQTSMKNCVRWTGVKLSLFGLTIVQYWDRDPLFRLRGARPHISLPGGLNTVMWNTGTKFSQRTHILPSLHGYVTPSSTPPHFVVHLIPSCWEPGPCNRNVKVSYPTCPQSPILIKNIYYSF